MIELKPLLIPQEHFSEACLTVLVSILAETQAIRAQLAEVQSIASDDQIADTVYARFDELRKKNHQHILDQLYAAYGG
jgi:hypothetical protein